MADAFLKKCYEHKVHIYNLLTGRYRVFGAKRFAKNYSQRHTHCIKLHIHVLKNIFLNKSKKISKNVENQYSENAT